MIAIRISSPEPYRVRVAGAGAGFAAEQKTPADYQADAMALVRRLSQTLWPIDSDYRATVLKWVSEYTEDALRTQLAKWCSVLREKVKAPYDPTTNPFYVWAENQWNDLRWQRAHVQLWAAAIIARGFAPPDPVALAALDADAGAAQDAIGHALVSEAFKRGREEGLRVQQSVGFWGLLHDIQRNLLAIIEKLAELGVQVAKIGADSGVGLIFGGLAALGLLAYLSWRR